MSNRSGLDPDGPPDPASVPGADSSVEGRAPPGPRLDPYLGTTIDGRWLVERVLGEGGMGVVYLGRHKAIDKLVAIKVLRADMARDAEITGRFRQEARAASSIGNEHIVDISDFGDLPDGSTYFVMELLDGRALAELLAEVRPLPLARIIAIALQITDGLAAAHRSGIVHRDLKPDNVFLVRRGGDDDFVKILDFGIAKVGTGTSKITRAGTVFGTPHYMSPEQALGATVDARTDVYALGVILYEMASGRVPFDADNFMGILTQHMYKAPVALRALVPTPDVPPGLEAIVLKALSKKPEQRYATMDELADDLRVLEAGGVPLAVGEMMSRSAGFQIPADYLRQRGMPLPVPGEPPARSTRRSWATLAGVAGALVALGLVALVLARGGEGTPSPAGSVASAAPSANEPSAAPVVAPIAPPSAAASATPVLFASEPLDAHAIVAGRDLGTPPLHIDVPAGQSVEVSVERDGYRTERVVLDGSLPRVQIVLKRNAAQRAPSPSATTATAKTASTPATATLPAPTTPPRPAPRVGDIVDPWAPR